MFQHPLSPVIESAHHIPGEIEGGIFVIEGNGGFPTDRREALPLSYQTLGGLSYWTGFVGIWFIIGAILSLIGTATILFLGGFVLEAFAGAAGSIVGAIIMLVLGVKLRHAKRSIADYIASGKAAILEDGLKCTKSYFKIVGILIIIGLIIAVFAIVFSVFATSFLQDMFSQVYS